MEFFITKMDAAMIFAFNLRCESLVTNIAMELWLLRRFVVSAYMHFQIPQIVKRLIAMIAFMHHRIGRVDATMVLELFGIFEAFITDVASIIFAG